MSDLEQVSIEEGRDMLVAYRSAVAFGKREAQREAERGKGYDPGRLLRIEGNTSRLIYAIRRCKWPAIERSMYIAQLLDELEKEYL